MAEIAGLKLIVPSSVAGSGVSVSASGKVTFTAATTVSINGVFSATYDNYLIVCRHLHSTTNTTFQFRLRASGSDASGANYTQQLLRAGSTTVFGIRQTGDTIGNCTFLSADNRSGHHQYLYGPALAQPTAYRTVAVSGASGGAIEEWAGTHSLSTAYDGISLIAPANTMTGACTVYGLSQ
jgi:hypothetical protein